MNGDFLGWPTWDTALPQCTNNPIGSDYYQVILPIKGGNPRRLQFKFGLSGPSHSVPIDNENPTYSDHVKYVRDYNASYTLPAAEFGNLYLSSLVEPVFGNLKAGEPVGGNIPITWLGCPCATLQVRTNINSGSWVDLPATDATSATNWPNTGADRFFRLQKRPFP